MDNKSMNALGDKIKQRTEIRQQVAEEKRATRNDKVSENENVDKFYGDFAKKKEYLNNYINERANNKDDLESIRNGIVSLQQQLNEASMYLPSFQLKKSQEAIDSLTERHANLQDSLFPKKRFGFKSNPTVTPVIVSVKEKDDLPPNDAGGIAALLESNFFGFRNISDSTLYKSAHELQNKQLNLQNLLNCQVHAFGNCVSLQISSLTDCIIHVGPTTRSAFIKNCKGCTFVIACQQVRIHYTTDSHFFLHVTGSVIIEDCSEVRFSPYNLSYDNLDQHYVDSGLCREVNKWDEVQDFHWLNEKESSPNFSLVY